MNKSAFCFCGSPIPFQDCCKKYIDGILIGAVVGLGGVILAEKQGWITNIDKKNKIYGAIAGAVLGTYYIYRFQK